MNYINLSPI